MSVHPYTLSSDVQRAPFNLQCATLLVINEPVLSPKWRFCQKFSGPWGQSNRARSCQITATGGVNASGVA
jgi:hypothetical protein